jgi:hypothetical protein
MKHACILILLFLGIGEVGAQKTLMVEKVGASRRYFYAAGDYIKLRTISEDTLLRGKLWSVNDSSLFVYGWRPFEVRLGDIGSVYKQYYFPKKFGIYMTIGSAGIFAIIAFNHMINNEQVFTPDMFIISGSMLGAGLISLSLSQKRCRTGMHWKIKVLDLKITGN